MYARTQEKRACVTEATARCKTALTERGWAYVHLDMLN